MSKTFAHLYTDPAANMLNVPLDFERVPLVGEYIHVWLNSNLRGRFGDESGASVFRVGHVELVAAGDGGPPLDYTSELFARYVNGMEYLDIRRTSLEAQASQA